MDDEQPLLDSSNLFHWRRWLKGKEKDKNRSVGYLQLFRYSDGVDYLLIFLSMCMIMIHMVCFLTNLILSGQIAGLFATESFDNDCFNQTDFNLFNQIKNNTLCPLGIDLNAYNSRHFERLCRPNNVTLTSTFPFEKKVMNLIHWLLIVDLGEFVFAWVALILWMMSIRRQTLRMNVLLFKSLLQRNLSYFDTTPMSQFNAELFTNIEKIEIGISLELILLIEVSIAVIGALIISFVINWPLSFILLCLIIIVIPISLVLGRITANESANELESYSKVGEIVAEVFSSLRTVFSLNGIKYEQKRYEDQLRQTRWNSLKKGATFGILMGWLSFVTYIIYPIAFIFASLVMLDGDQNELNISDILVIVSVFAPCMRYFGSTGSYFQSYSEGRAAAVSVFQLIDQAEDANLNEEDVWKEENRSVEKINENIRFENVQFFYPSRKEVSILRNLSFIARAGERTALVGLSGCGKSTCLSLLLRQYEFSSGQIKIGDRSITDYDRKELRQNIGVVGQEPVLLSMSIFENIRLGNVGATSAEIESASKQANAHDFILKLPNKYQTFVGEGGVQLSGGEKQRIVLARALVQQPSILLLDEATSALDRISERIVQQAIDQASKNRTTIVIAHRLSTIRNADQIYVLENGSVIEEGTHQSLMNKEGGRYQIMLQIQELQNTQGDENDVSDEDEQSITKRSQSYTNSETSDTNKENCRSANERSVFLRLLSLNRSEWRILLVAGIVCAINGGTQTVLTILVSEIIKAFNHCLNSNIRDQVLKSSLVFLFLSIVLLIARFIQCTTFSLSGLRLTERIRLKSFQCLLRQEMSYFDRPENSSSTIGVRLSSDASAIEQVISTRMGVICETIALSCFGLLFGMFFSWELTLIVVLIIFIITVTVYLNVHFNVQLKKESDPLLRKANTFAVEVLSNIRTIKQLAVEKEVFRQYSQLIDEVLRMSWKPVCISSMANSLIWALDAFAMAILYWCALILFQKKELTSDNIIMVFSFGIFATQSLKIVGVLAERVGPSLSAAQNFFDLFDRTPTIDNASTDGQELLDFRGELQFDHVNFVYPSRPTSTVLRDFHLTIKPGQRVALVGTSGCGKSTVIQLLERFYDVTHGQLFLDGVNIRQLNIYSVRSRLGLVSQEPLLFNLTIAENISYGLENIPMESIIDAANSANIHQFIEQLPQGYETKVGVKGSFLSGGEKQRIAIARALIRRPKILLLDEATSALDSYNERIVQQVLDQAQLEDPTRTSLIIAHRLSTIRSCDLICVLDHGRIVESGNHQELLERRGIYYRMLTEHNS